MKEWMLHDRAKLATKKWKELETPMSLAYLLTNLNSVLMRQGKRHWLSFKLFAEVEIHSDTFGYSVIGDRLYKRSTNGLPYDQVSSTCQQDGAEMVWTNTEKNIRAFQGLCSTDCHSGNFISSHFIY